MRLSVLIPCYNENETILPVVEAVKASPYPDKEIIIVDDCSDDGTRERLRTKLFDSLITFCIMIQIGAKGRPCDRLSRPQLVTSF